MSRATLGLMVLLALAGCRGAQDNTDRGAIQEAAQGTVSATPAVPASASPATPAVPVRAEDFPQLASRDCVEVAQFALEAIGAHEFARAALAWNSSTAVDAASLKAAFGNYTTPEFTWAEPTVEGGAGSLYCTITATLKDAGDAKKVPVEGTFMLRRVNDVDGASAEQLRWTVRSSTFVEAGATG